MQRRIGLTGGIATGKSTVSQYLILRYQLPVLDADQWARWAMRPGSPVLDWVSQRYGAAMLHPDGTVNRQRLGEQIFNDPRERQSLEAQIHPIVRQQIQTQLQDPEMLRSQLVVLDIPLLFEAQMTDLVTEVWVVTCSLHQQLERLEHRNGLTPDQAQARIDSQWPLTQKIQAADVVLDNSTTLENLYQQVDQALQRS